MKTFKELLQLASRSPNDEALLDELHVALDRTRGTRRAQNTDARDVSWLQWLIQEVASSGGYCADETKLTAQGLRMRAGYRNAEGQILKVLIELAFEVQPEGSSVFHRLTLLASLEGRSESWTVSREIPAHESKAENVVCSSLDITNSLQIEEALRNLFRGVREVWGYEVFRPQAPYQESEYNWFLHSATPPVEVMNQVARDLQGVNTGRMDTLGSPRPELMEWFREDVHQGIRRTNRLDLIAPRSIPLRPDLSGSSTSTEKE